MAFKLSVSDRFGATHPEAYHKIREVRLFWTEKRAHIMVEKYINQTARDNEEDPFDQQEFRVNSATYDSIFGISVLDTVSVNSIKKSYDHVKSVIDDPAIVDC